MPQRRVHTVVLLVLTVALGLAGCGSSPPPTQAPEPTEASTNASSAEPSAAEPSTTAPEASAASSQHTPTTDPQEEAEASRSAEREDVEEMMGILWDGEDSSFRHSLCHYWSTEPDSILDTMVSGLDAPPGTGEDAVESFLDKACADLAAESAETATDKGTYAELSERDLAVVVKDPDAHSGERFVVYGHIEQLDAATGQDNLLADISHNQRWNSYEFEHSVMARAGDEELFKDLVEGDIVRMHVEVLGALSYDTQIGGNTTVPLLRVNMAESVGFD